MNRLLRRHRLRVLLAAALLAASAAHAQARPASIDLASAPLDKALNQLAQQTGTQIIFASDIASDKTAAALQGSFTAREALDRLLVGTGLVARMQDETTFVVVALPPNDGATVLPSVKVSAEAESGAGAANEGYRAREAAVAGFSSRSIQDTPQSIRVISAELIANQFVDDLEDLARLDASVTAAYRQPGFHARTEIRGFSVEDGENYRYNGLNFLRQQLTPLENKERVEILKGLSALQSGFASPGGIINYVTKRPTVEAINDASFSFDQFGSALAHVDVSRSSADGKLGVRVNAAVEALESYVEEAGGNRQFVSLAGDWRIGDNSLVNLDVEYQKRDQVVQSAFRPNVDGRIPRGFDPTTFLGQSWANYETENLTINGRAEHAISRQWTAIIEGNWNSTTHPFNDIGFSDIQENGDTQAFAYISRGTKRDASSVRPMLKGNFELIGMQHELIVGASAQETHADSGGFFYGAIGETNIYHPVALADPKPTIESSRAGFKLEDRGAFINDIVSLTGAWQLHLGGRYVDRDQRSFDAAGEVSSRQAKQQFSPALATIFKPIDRVATYLSYVEGLENGGIAPQTANGMPVTNAGEVKAPLVSKQWEVGVKADITERLSGEVALFQIERPSTFIDGSNTFVQAGEQINRGIELSMTGKLGDAWTLFGSTLLLDAELKKTGDPTTQGKRPTSVPKQRTALTAEYSPPALVGWTFSGNWSHTGDRPLDDSNSFEFARSFDVFALGGRYTTRLDGRLKAVTFRGGVDNLFDERYFSTSTYGQLIAGAPRTVSFNMALSF